MATEQEVQTSTENEGSKASGAQQTETKTEASTETVTDGEIEELCEQLESPDDEDIDTKADDCLFTICVDAIKSPNEFNAATLKSLVALAGLNELWQEAEQYVADGLDDDDDDDDGDEAGLDDPEPAELETLV
jgi:hypothetical protein